jgi:hypothetical protein
MTPIATLANLTATGDLIIGPGYPLHLNLFLPVACMGDMVTGPLCISGAITFSTALTYLCGFRPVANLGSLVVGISPIGIPVPTAAMVCPAINYIV